MRVPTLNAPTVQASNPYSDARPNILQPDLRPAQTIGELGKAVDATGQAIGGLMQREAEESAAKQKAALEAAAAEAKRARELTIADGVVDVQRRATDDEVKFKRNQGLTALKTSGPALDGLDKHISEVGARFTDPAIRAEFETRAKAAILGNRKSIEEHTSKEYASGIKQTYGNLRDTALRTAASVELTPDEMKLVLAPVDQGADEFMSPEEAKQAKLELRGDVAEAVIVRRVAAGDVDGAEEQLVLDRALLGEKREKGLKDAITSKRKELDAKATAIEVNGIAEKTRDENNITMPQALRDAMPKLEPGDPRREAYEAALEKQLTIEKKRMDELVDYEANNASVAIDDGVPIPKRTVDRLRKYDNERLRGLLDKQEARRRSARVERDGNRRELAELRREQAEINKEAEERFARELIANPNANHAEFITRFTRDVSARMGRPVTVTPLFEAKLERDAAATRQEKDTEKFKAKSAFAQEVEGEIDGMTKPFKKGSREDLELTKSWAGYAALSYEAEVAMNGGKPLDAEQKKKLAARIIHEAATGPKKTVVKPPPAPLGPEYRPAAVKPTRAVKSYGYSADGKTRIPRYTDGTLGEPEPVP